MICQKCGKEFEEREMELSHDIPKYTGGTDNDGRHWLCKTCHEDYDNLILSRILFYLSEDGFNLEERILWMKELSIQPSNLKKEFIKIAKKVKEEFFNNKNG